MLSKACNKSFSIFVSIKISTMRKKITFALALIFQVSLQAQLYDRNYDIPVTVDGSSMDNPWAGGLNSCQVSRIDANMDGKKDIFIFDRIGSRISIYLNMDDTPGAMSYKYTRDYNAAFPTNLRNWLLLRDMNCDGLEDICTNTGSGFKIYWNTSDATLSFNPVSSGTVTAEYDFGAGPYNSGVYCIAPDMPAFNDYDNDGDIDIWSWNEYSSSEYFYKNMAVENGDCTVPDFVCRNRCYGHFGESPDSFQIFFGDDFECDFNVTEPREEESGPLRHTGGTTLAVDLDQNGFRDLIIGDVTDNTLKALMLEDGSDLQDSVFEVHDDFPATFAFSTSVFLRTFPAAFYEDVNNDGISDLLVSPNTFSDGEDRKSLVLYLNNGLNDLPDFELITNDFLQSDMIDLGLGAYPVVFDVDNDGLKDLVIANRKYFEPGNPLTSRIWYYRNTGTATSPAFTLEDENWMDIPGHGWNYAYPSFGDLDGDGDADMVIGDLNGLLHYFRNEAPSGEPAEFVLDAASMFDAAMNILDVGQSATPQIVDLNEDGLNDLVIGVLNGGVSYYKNIGTAEDYSFQFVEDTIGDAVATSLLGIQGKSVPFMFKDEEGHWQLLIGTETGQINHYDQIEGNISGSFHLVTENYEGINEGERSSVFLSDITGDGLNDMFIGNIGGGVGVYTHLPIGIEEQYLAQEIKVYPNPANDKLWLELPEGIPTAQIRLYDSMGRIVKAISANAKRTQLDVSDLGNGVYILQTTSKNVIGSARIVVKK